MGEADHGNASLTKTNWFVWLKRWASQVLRRCHLDLYLHRALIWVDVIRNPLLHFYYFHVSCKLLYIRYLSAKGKHKQLYSWIQRIVPMVKFYVWFDQILCLLKCAWSPSTSFIFPNGESSLNLDASISFWQSCFIFSQPFPFIKACITNLTCLHEVEH